MQDLKRPYAVLQLGRRPGESFLIDLGESGLLWMTMQSSENKVCRVTIQTQSGEVKEYSLSKFGSRTIDYNARLSIRASDYSGRQVKFAFHVAPEVSIVRGELLTIFEKERVKVLFGVDI